MTSWLHWYCFDVQGTSSNCVYEGADTLVVEPAEAVAVRFCEFKKCFLKIQFASYCISVRMEKYLK